MALPKSLPIYGFTLLRNGMKYDYPFRESLRSLVSLCDEVFVALGDCTDGTEESLKDIPKLKIIPTVWDENLRQGGMILSQQTNIALESLRKAHPIGWGVYLQADEVFREQDAQILKASFVEAEKLGADAIRFRYLHFWERPDQIAIGKKWYPQEIRAIRLDSAPGAAPIESYGDAQSFKNVKQVLDTDAFVFHYGHVRSPEAYAQKKKDFHRWWHADHAIQKVLKQGEQKDSHEETISFLGSHPAVMNERNAKWPTPPKPDILWVKGGEIPQELERLLGMIENIEIVRSDKMPEIPGKKIVKLQSKIPWYCGICPSFPGKMKRKDARQWSAEFVWGLKLSALGIRSRF